MRFLALTAEKVVVCQVPHQHAISPSCCCQHFKVVDWYHLETPMGKGSLRRNKRRFYSFPLVYLRQRRSTFGSADKHTWLKKWRQRNRDWLKLAQMDDLDTNLVDGLRFIEKLNLQLVNYELAQLSSIMWLLHPKLRVLQISKECCESRKALTVWNFYWSSHFAHIKFTTSKKQSLWYETAGEN